MLLLVLIDSCTFETLVYPESWHIQNQKHIQNAGIFTILVYLEPRYTCIFRMLAYSKPEACSEGAFVQEASAKERFLEVVNGCNYFRKLFSHYKLAALFTSLNKYHNVVTPDVVIICKKYYGTRGDRGTWVFSIPIDIYKFPYLQLITILVCGSILPKSHEQGYLNF